MAHEFVGQGIAFPFRVGVSGGLALVADDRELEEAIRLILGTAPGERPMRPEFGCRVHDYVFAAADASTAGNVAFEVRTALERWEPRIELEDVDVNPDPVRRDTLLIDIRYRVAGTNDPRNLVFPFYTIPSEG